MIKKIIIVLSLLFSSLCFGLEITADQTEIVIHSNGIFKLYANNEYNDTCYSYIINEPAICYFKHKEEVGFKKITINDTNYEIYINKSQIFKPNNLITISKQNYEISFDKSTGTIYELKYKNNNFNLVHSHFGAAIQVALHQGQINDLFFDLCAQGGGYYNPTQAGALCSYPYQFIVLPSGNNYNKRDNILDFENMRLYNFTYGEEYQGPYNDKDQFYLTQRATFFNDFIEIEYTTTDNSNRNFGVLQNPTLYLSHLLTNFQYSENNNIHSFILSQFDFSKIKQIPFDYDWIYLSDELKNNSFMFSSIPSDEMKNDSIQLDSQKSYIFLTPLYHRFNLTFNTVIKYQPSKEYKSWFIILPANPNDKISTPFGDMLAKNFMIRVKNFYNDNNKSLRILSTTDVDNIQISDYRSNTILWDIQNIFDNDENTCYSTTKNDPNPWVAFWFKQLTYIHSIELKPRIYNNQILSFPNKINVYITTEDNSKWIIVDNLNNINKNTFGILIVPNGLGKDDNNDNYFQLCEIKIN